MPSQSGATPQAVPPEHVQADRLASTELDEETYLDDLGSPQLEALALLQDWLVDMNNLPEIVTPAFQGVTYETFANQLYGHLVGETSPYQGGTWLCGPTALTQVLLLEDPVSYTRLALDLFTKGTAQAAGATASIQASDSMLDDDAFRDTGEHWRSRMPALDFLMVGALRHTANQTGVKDWLLDDHDYNPGSASERESGTLPNEVSGMASRLLGLDVLRSAYYRGENIGRMIEAHEQGHSIVFLIDATGLAGDGGEKDGAKSEGFYGFFGKHYVVVDAGHTLSRNGDAMQLSYWDYGGRLTELDIPVDQFRQGVKGYWVLDGGLPASSPP